MNKSSSSVSGKSKFKIVFLGDTNTGKTSIIERFINDKFNPESTVRKSLVSPPLALISSGETSTTSRSTIGSSYGILQVRNDTKV
jgi:GTPase SAR1 family protein